MNNANIHYNGLVNQGATCYLNSVLQVLYMTKGFREAVESHTCKNPQCVECDLKHLFEDLKKKTACPSTITEKLGINRVNEQQDAAEYFENMLRLTSPGTAQVFHGELTHKITCSKCREKKSSDEQFWHLPLALMDSCSNQYNVENGIEEFFRASDFRGEDQMYCEGCDDKADATTTCEVKQHPDVLMLLLKRFHLDYNHMTYVKNNQAVCVPCTLEIPQNQKYDLYAVVDHFGDLRGGHYTATIKSQDDDDNRWYCFNDKTVTVLSQFDISEISQSAYLLFYKKHTTDAADTGAENIREVSTNGALPPDVSDKCDQSNDSENLIKTEEDEKATEIGNNAAEALASDRNGSARIRDMFSVESPGRQRYLTKYDLCYHGSEDHGVFGDKKEKMSRRLREDHRGQKISLKQTIREGGSVESSTKYLTKYDLHLCSYQRSEDCAVDGDRKGNMSKDDQGCELGNSSLDLKPEQQTDEKRDVNRHKEQRRKNEQAERNGSSTTNFYHSEGLEGQQRSEQKVSDTCKDVHVEKQDKDQENQGDNKQIKNRGESSFVQAESESGRLTEEHEAEKKRQKAKKINVKIIEEEFTTTPSGGIQKITKIKNIRVEAGDKTTDMKETLSERVCNLKLNEPEKNRNKRGNEDEIEMNSTLPSNAKKLKQ